MTAAGQRVDQGQRDLVVAGEVGDLPVPFDDVGARAQARGARGALRRPSGRGRRPGSRGRPRCCRPAAVVGGRGRGRRAARARSATPVQSAAAPHQSLPPRPKCSSTTGATSRSVHCSRSRGAPRAAADEEQRPEAVAAVQRAVAAAAGVAGPAPVDRLVAGRERDDEVAGVRRGERREDPRQRVGVPVAAQPSARRSSPRAPRARRRSSQRRAAQVLDAPRRAGSEAARRARSTTAIGASPAGDGPSRAAAAGCPSGRSQPADEVDPFGLGQAAADLVVVGRAALRRQQVDVRGAAGRADRQLRRLGPLLGGREDRPLAGQQLGQRQAAVDRRLGVVGDEDQRVRLEEAVEAAGRLDQLGEAGVGAGDRLDARLGPVAVRVVVVVGEREEQEVEGVRRAPARPRSRPSRGRGRRGSRSTCRAPRGSRRGRRRRARAGPRCGGRNLSRVASTARRSRPSRETWWRWRPR